MGATGAVGVVGGVGATGAMGAVGAVGVRELWEALPDMQPLENDQLTPETYRLDYNISGV